MGVRRAICKVVAIVRDRVQIVARAQMGCRHVRDCRWCWFPLNGPESALAAIRTGGGGGGGRGGPPVQRGPRDVDYLARLFDPAERDHETRAVTCMEFHQATNELYVGYKSGHVRRWGCSNWQTGDKASAGPLPACLPACLPANRASGAASPLPQESWQMLSDVDMKQGGEVTALHLVGDPNQGGFLFVACTTVRDARSTAQPARATVSFFSSLAQGVLEGHLVGARLTPPDGALGTLKLPRTAGQGQLHLFRWCAGLLPFHCRQRQDDPGLGGRHHDQQLPPGHLLWP